MKWLGIVASWLRADGRVGDDLKLLLEGFGTVEPQSRALRQSKACLNYSADGKGLPGPVSDRVGAAGVPQGYNDRSSLMRIRSSC